MVLNYILWSVSTEACTGSLWVSVPFKEPVRVTAFQQYMATVHGLKVGVSLISISST